MNVSVPSLAVPANGFPVCVLLHGNGGQGQGMIAQFQNNLECHVLVAPTGYMNSWNISEENSDAPDVEMVAELVTQLQTYSNVDASKIRILGFSNGSALANRLFVENTDPGIDIICGFVSQLSEANYHNGNFYSPSGQTSSSLPYCGYDLIATPITGRKYLSICNSNDPLIPYLGGSSLGVTFLDAQEAAFIVAQSQGYTGSQLPSPGNYIGSAAAVVEEFSYLSNQVIHLKGDAGHGANSTQLDYVKSYFTVDCSPANIDQFNDVNIELFPNPTSDFVTIQIDNYSADLDVFIYDVYGKLVGYTNSYTIDLGNYSSGLYFFKLFTKSFTEEIKVIKQ